LGRSHPGTQSPPSVAPDAPAGAGSGATGETPAQTVKPVPIHRRRNPFFCGREEILSRLRDAFLEIGRDGIANIQALSGLGGVGKTQIAVEYVYRHHAEYQHVFWLNAASTLTIDAGFMEIARRLELPEARTQDKADIADCVRRWLAANGGWLLVLDNADEPELVQSVIVGNRHGHYLLTSRQSVLDGIGVASPLQVGVMSPEEASSFLLTRTNRLSTTGEELGAAKQIAEELGDLPLALEQAGSYIFSRKPSFAGYLAAYRARKLELLAKAPPKTGDYTETVSTTWSLNLDAVREESAASATLLGYIAFLYPDDIPFELLPKGAKEFGGEIASFLKDFYVDHDELENPCPRINETLIDDLLYPLTRYSLIEKFPEGRTFSIHRLVQEVIKAGIDQQEARARRAKLIKVMADAFPIVSYEYWPLCSRLLRHAIELVGPVDRAELQSVEAGTLLHRAAHFLEETGDYQLSVSIYQHAVKVREVVLGADHEDTGTSINNMGLVMFKLGYFKQAEETLRRALAVRSKACGERHRDVGQTWNNLALAVGELGRLDESQECLNKAREILEQETDGYDEGKMTTLSNIANLMHKRGKEKEAEEITRNVLAQREANLGEMHPLVAFTLCNLAVYAGERGDTREGLDLIRRAMAIQEEAIGQIHPDYANSCNAYANLLTQDKQYDEAIKAYRLAGEVMAHTMGPRHPRIATVLINLGHCYQEMGNREQAIAHYQRAVDLLEARVGPEHIGVAAALNNLAYCHMLARDGVNARALYQRVLAIRRKVYGPTHKDVAVALGNLALIEERIGKPGDALKLYQEAASVFSDLGDPRIRDCINFLTHYRSCLRRMNRFDDAAKITARLRAMGES
jgi:tetratricopeptide (TPR) repeat protein